ncbi:MAG: tetratricopeptide repeat protein [Pyrinomonadaceae bacterium]
MRLGLSIFLGIVVTAGTIGCGGTTVPDATPQTPAEPPAASAVDIASISDPQAALAEGNRLLDENQTQSAIDAYKHAVGLNPDLADAHFQLGIAYELLALQNELSGVVTESPAANAKGKAPRKTDSEKAFEKAVEAYEKRIDADHKDHSAYFSLGRTYVKLLKDAEAEKAFKQAVKLNPDDTEYQTELGSILIVLAQYAEAIGPLKKAIELDPANARAEDMLEDAKAGRQRIDYVSKNTNANQAVNKAVKPSSRVASNSNSNSVPLPAANTRPREVPKNPTPRPANRP